MEVYAGTAVTTIATFTVAGAATDPTTVTLKFKPQSGPTTTWTYGSGSITRTAQGVYQATIDTTGSVGICTVEWIGTGAAQVVQATTFLVDTPPL